MASTQNAAPQGRNWMYPDNDKREKRAEMLVIMIGEFQDNVKRERDVMLANEKDDYEALAQITKNAGYPTIDAYVDNALKVLSPADREAFYKMRDSYVKQEASLGISAQVAGAIGGLATAAGISAVVVKIFVMDKMVVVMGIRAIAEGIYKIVTGSVQLGTQLIGTAITSIKSVLVGASNMGDKAAKALHFFKAAGKFLTVAAVLLEIGNLIAQGFTGAQMRSEYQRMIKEYASRRFSAYATQLKIDGIKKFKNAASVLVALRLEWEEDKLSKEEIDIKTKAYFEKLQPKFDIAMVAVDDAAVQKGLSERDAMSGAWTNEDPDLPTMLAWLDANFKPVSARSTITRSNIDEDYIVTEPWNWNPQGISPEKVELLSVSALDYKAFAGVSV